ncbi:acyltransferase [Sulfitobacter sp. F26204]|uniref:acyltransferase n=1 Tax=Sulfitobacter sp. F26204 TaxID=2996014 RepID=UPI00225E23F6|nr:acyltransferase [Sulfitobacter sp. F26204]MCX7559707.1 acyltransferase [Sulfitobacter sp. F26204]
MSRLHRVLYKIERIIGLTAIKLAPIIRPGFATTIAVKVYGRWGMNFVGTPNYLSARINFDGTDYGLIEIHEGVTISSYVRVLTHDWSLYTVAKAIHHFAEKPIGEIKGVSIGEYSFVGTGTIIMPGSRIGRGCIIGAGTVVRGNIPDYSIIIGSPCQNVGDTRRLIASKFERMGIDSTPALAEFLLNNTDPN